MTKKELVGGNSAGGGLLQGKNVSIMQRPKYSSKPSISDENE